MDDETREAIFHSTDALGKRIDALERSLLRELDHESRAIELRFQQVNEFRAALADQAAEFLPRREYREAHDALALQLTRMIDRVSTLEGRIAGYAGVAAFLGVAAALLSHFLA